MSDTLYCLNCHQFGHVTPDCKQFVKVAQQVTRCFTFGSCHSHPNGFVRITADTVGECRAEMFRRYRNKWAFEYSEEQIADQQKRFPQLHEVPLDEPQKRKFIVRYNVEFSREVEAESEQDAIEQCLENDPDTEWDQRSTSQYEAEESPETVSQGEQTAMESYPNEWKKRQSQGETEAAR
jgi:hypothetical protein